MSLFNLNEPNNYNARFNSLKSHSYEVWDDATQRFVPLTGGGGGGDPTPLPYYLKENEIRIQNNTTGAFSIMDPANFAIDGGTAGVGITKDMLMFADSSGSATLTKPKLDVLTQMKTDIADAADTSGTYSTPVVYNPTTKKFLKNTPFSIVNPANISNRSQLNHSDITCYRSASEYIMIGGGNTEIKVNSSANTVTMFSSLVAAGNGLSIKVGASTKYLKIEDLDVTNQLKALTSKVTDANSKMMIYDATTKLFNYATIPTGGTSYAYNQATGIYMNVGPTDEGKFPNGIQINGNVDGIQTTLNGDKIIMSDYFADPIKEASVDYNQFKRLSTIASFKNEARLIDFTQCQTLKFASGNAPTVTGTPGLNPTITGFKAGDKYFFKGVAGFTFDPAVWYSLPFTNANAAINTRWKITLHRDVSQAGSPDSFTLFHTYDYTKDTAQVRYTSIGTGTIPVNSLLFQIKIGSGNRQWSDTDMFCIELVEIPTVV